MIYGYCGKKINHYGLFEMQEVTFSMSSQALRALSQFLNDMADRIDEKKTDNSSHYHIESVVPNWREICPSQDIIVMIEQGK